MWTGQKYRPVRVKMTSLPPTDLDRYTSAENSEKVKQLVVVLQRVAEKLEEEAPFRRQSSHAKNGTFFSPLSFPFPFPFHSQLRLLLSRISIVANVAVEEAIIIRSAMRSSFSLKRDPVLRQMVQFVVKYLIPNLS